MSDPQAFQALLFRRQQLQRQREEAVREFDRQMAEVDALILAFPVAELAPVSTELESPPSPPLNGTTNDYLLWHLRRSPVLDYGACATEYFGEDNARNRQRLHKALDYLRRTGTIRLLGYRTWEIRVRKRRGRPPKNPEATPE
jgi:hypothetical protein